jgi:hypothetical protein
MVCFRYCVAPLSLNGLGNQFFCWAKAFIASQELGATLLHPAWSRNPRGYRHLFGTPPLDWEAYRLLTKALPVFEFNQADYKAAGGGNYGKAVQSFAQSKGLGKRRAYVLITSGMWGGYAAIRHARHFVLAQLYTAKNTSRHLYSLSKQLHAGHLTVAVHIRRGDFWTPKQTGGWKGALTTALPLEWYVSICRTLNAHFSGRVQFLLFSDGPDSELRDFCDEFEPIRMAPENHSVAGDLIAMAAADLLVCSTSTFSLIAGFLSNAPYLWFEPQLESAADFYSLANEGLTQNEARVYGTGNEKSECAAPDQPGLMPRGIPVRDSGHLPDSLLNWLDQRLGFKNPSHDLIYYGRVPRHQAPA